MVKSPFMESVVSKGSVETVVRKFDSNIDPNELKWHWDDEDRIVYPIGESDWMFQFDNELPINIRAKIKIPKGTWHRIIKGTGDLQIIVEKIKDI
jgi:hypothetical protein